MSADMEQLVAQLRASADGVVLPAGSELRRRGDRRRRLLAIAAAAAAAVVVASSTAGAVVLLGGGETIAPSHPTAPASPPAVTTPAPTPSPESTPGPLGSPIAYPPGCDGDFEYVGDTFPTGGAALPTSVMLDASDFGRCYLLAYDAAGYGVFDPRGDFKPQPDVCHDGAPYAADAHRIAGRFRGFAGGPELGAYESVTRYAPGQADAFLNEISARVAACATHRQQPEPGVVWHSRVVQTGFAGEDSLLVYVGTSATEEAYPGWFAAVVRVGDTVVVVEPYVDLGGDHAFTVRMAQVAAAKL